MITKAFSVVLRELRLKNNLSQEKIAEYCDLDRTYISMLERRLSEKSGHIEPFIRRYHFFVIRAMMIKISRILSAFFILMTFSPNKLPTEILTSIVFLP